MPHQDAREQHRRKSKNVQKKKSERRKERMEGGEKPSHLVLDSDIKPKGGGFQVPTRAGTGDLWEKARKANGMSEEKLLLGKK